jgi:hypothetical protein
MLCYLLCRLPQAARSGDAGLLGGDELDGPDAFLSLGSQLELASRADIDLADDEETGEAGAVRLCTLLNKTVMRHYCGD